MSVVERNNVRVSGKPAGPAMLFAHGFGCAQEMWRYVTPAFEADYRVVVFDHVGCGHSDATHYDPIAYRSLDRYAADVLEIITELDLREVIFVGHSVSAMIGVLASVAQPERFAGLVMVGPSPRYIDDAEYVGGLDAGDIDELLDSLDSNYLGWSRAMAPVIMGQPDRPELGDELLSSFCRVDPAIARQFARATFLADNRDDLCKVSVPTLIVQCAYDVIAPVAVGTYVHDHVRDSELVILEVSGHCPNLSAPELTIEAIRGFLRRAGLPS